MTKKLISWWLLLACLPVIGESITGFVDPAAQFKLEAAFDGHLDARDQDQWMLRLSARPHHLGSEFDRENAEFIRDEFASWGYDASLETYEVLFPTPKERLLEMLEPKPFKASLTEPALPEDRTSGQKEEQLPVYNAYSVDGDVTAEVVYVNYGVPKDYEELERRGVDVKGKIVLARYLGSWRGIKPKVAAEKGAIGTIIYSDPSDDGYVRGDAYPKGAFRGALGAQRGSVMDMPLYPGDPLTPGIGAAKGAKRLKREEAETITKIPVIPISYADALPILESLGGPVVPESWKGGLPVTYHTGPGPAKVRLRLAFDWQMVTAYNVVARMPGAVYPDEWVIRGNHHDAWVNGARDPVSGMVALMAEAKAMAKLRSEGWMPKRSILFIGWDAEEQGLMGSTEWVEDHLRELRQKAVVYVNTDGNSRGFLSAGGSHTLEQMVNEIAREVRDPQVEGSVAERLKARVQLVGSADAAKEITTRKNFRLSPLGSGSDYSPFLQHAGIASLNLSFSGEGNGGSYHSIYDSYDHFIRFSDPGFHYGVALAQTAGRVVLRMANADVLPFEFGGFADNANRYVEEVEKLADSTRKETLRINKLVDDNVFKLALDPTEADRGPKKMDPVPYLSFASLKNALERLERGIQAFEAAQKDADLAAASKEDLRTLNQLLFQSERRLTREEGLPRRPWYRHYIYAPGFYTGYGVKTLPAIREAIEERYWIEADEKVLATADVLNAMTEQIEKAARLLRGVPGKK